MKKLFPLLFCICLLGGGCFSSETGVYREEIPFDAAAVLACAETGLDVFIEANRDDYFWYMNESEYSSLMEGYYGEYSGVGVTMLFGKDMEYPLISAVNRDSPAQEQGVKVGEYIKEVNGESVSGWSSDKVVDNIKGKAGTEVILTLLDAEGKERQVSLVRRSITSFSVEEREIEGYPQIAYIAISNFTENTVDEFRKLWYEIGAERDISGLIFDLRDNGGGSFPASLNLASCFIPKGNVLVYLKTIRGMTSEISSGNTQIDVPVIVLQNGNSASASEVFICAMLENGAAQSVGTLSYGKGITQNIISMLGGSGYRYTSSMYYTPSMFALHKVGLTPTFEVELSEDCDIADIYAADMEKDNQLRRAVELLTEGK